MAVLEASPLYRELLEQAKKTVFQEGVEQGRLEMQPTILQEGIEQERRKTVETLMQFRFGEIDPELEAIVSKLIALPVEEFSPFILQKVSRRIARTIC